MEKLALETKMIKRSCVVCGKEIMVTLYQDHTYVGGHFFGKLSLGKGEKAEYWECNPCFKEAVVANG